MTEATMADFLEIKRDPEELVGIGAQLAAQGAALDPKMAQHHHAIAAIEAQQPWKHDDAGNQFADNYFHAKPKDAGKSAPSYRDQAMSASQGNGAAMVEIGNALSASMADYSATDAEIGADITSVGTTTTTT
jgi:hypothetical protein